MANPLFKTYAEFWNLSWVQQQQWIQSLPIDTPIAGPGNKWLIHSLFNSVNLEGVVFASPETSNWMGVGAGLDVEGRTWMQLGGMRSGSSAQANVNFVTFYNWSNNPKQLQFRLESRGDDGKYLYWLTDVSAVGSVRGAIYNPMPDKLIYHKQMPS